MECSNYIRWVNKPVRYWFMVLRKKYVLSCASMYEELWRLPTTSRNRAKEVVFSYEIYLKVYFAKIFCHCYHWFSATSDNNKGAYMAKTLGSTLILSAPTRLAEVLSWFRQG